MKVIEFYQEKLKSQRKRIFVAIRLRRRSNSFIIIINYEASTCAKPIIPCKFIQSQAMDPFKVLVVVQHIDHFPFSTV